MRKEICSFPLIEGVKLDVGTIGKAVPMACVWPSICESSRFSVCLEKNRVWHGEIILFNDILLARRAAEALRDLSCGGNSKEIIGEGSLRRMIEAIEYYDKYHCLGIKLVERIFAEDGELGALRRTKSELERELETLREFKHFLKKWRIARVEAAMREVEGAIERKVKEIERRIADKLSISLAKPLDLTWAFGMYCSFERLGICVNLDDLMAELRRNPDKTLLAWAEVRARGLLISSGKKPR